MSDELKPGHCHKCGLELSDNPHPEAGKPSHYLKVGCPKECIPCLTLSRHQWAGRAMKAENDAADLRARIASLESASAEPKPEKRAPVQGYIQGIPWSLHLEAYDAYCARWSPQPALIDLEGRHCRGGFHTSELDEFVPGWRDRASEIAQLKARISELEAPASAQSSQQGAVDSWAPARIWLQRGVGECGSHTWCEDQIGDDIEEAEYVRTGAALTQATDSEQWPEHKFALIRDRNYDGEGLSLWTWNGENYNGADGDCLSRDPDGTLDGFTAEWLTDHQLEQRLNNADPDESDRLSILICEIRATCGDNGEREPDELVRYIAGLRRDAERWRWLQSNYGAIALHEKFSGDVPYIFTRNMVSRPWDEIIAAIDAALSQQQDKP